MRVHLALVHQALLVRVHELDRILDRDDVVGAGAIDVVDHRRQRRRLARAGRAGDEHEPLLQVAEVEDVRREPEPLGGQDLGRDDAEDAADAEAVHEDVGAEARQPGDLVGEVGVVPRLELFAVLRRRDLHQQPRQRLGAERRRILVKRPHLAVLADERRHRRTEMKVRCAQLAHPAEHGVDDGRSGRVRLRGKAEHTRQLYKRHAQAQLLTEHGPETGRYSCEVSRSRCRRRAGGVPFRHTA